MLFCGREGNAFVYGLGARSPSLNNEKTDSPPRRRAAASFRERGGVKCADPTCPAPVFTDRALAAALPDEVVA